jgi:hypothetical protein
MQILQKRNGKIVPLAFRNAKPDGGIGVAKDGVHCGTVSGYKGAPWLTTPSV